MAEPEEMLCLVEALSGRPRRKGRPPAAGTAGRLGGRADGRTASPELSGRPLVRRAGGWRGGPRPGGAGASITSPSLPNFAKRSARREQYMPFSLEALAFAADCDPQRISASHLHDKMI